MAAPLHPLPRLHQLMHAHRTTVKSLAGVIGRSEGYMRRRVDADNYLLDLTVEEIDKLARFFGVSAGGSWADDHRAASLPTLRRAGEAGDDGGGLALPKADYRSEMEQPVTRHAS